MHVHISYIHIPVLPAIEDRLSPGQDEGELFQVFPDSLPPTTKTIFCRLRVNSIKGCIIQEPTKIMGMVVSGTYSVKRL